MIRKAPLKRNTRNKPPARVGDEVILARGSGKKRKFNKKTAVVISSPRRGCWMTVQLLAQQVGRPLKWRKGSYKEYHGISQREDPLKLIGDEVWINIFSFLTSPKRSWVTSNAENGDENQGRKHLTSFQWVYKKVPRFHAKLRAVCRMWRTCFDRVLPSILGLIDADLCAIRNQFRGVLPFVHWLCRYRIRLGRLNVYGNLLDIPPIIELLNKCDTEQLTMVRSYFNTIRAKQSALPIWGDYEIIDCSDPNEYYSRKDLMSCKEEKKLHETIAEQCPNLRDLAVTVTFPCSKRNYWDHTSKALFSMPGVTRLKLSFGIISSSRGLDNERCQIDGYIFTKLIQNLPNLKELTISTAQQHDLYAKRFHVESVSLEVLDAVGLAKGIYLSCECPRLKHFSCNGGFGGNGVLPMLTSTEQGNLEKHMEDRQESNNMQDPSRMYGRDLVVKASTLHFKDFEVPDNCEIRIKHFQINNFHLYLLSYNVFTEAMLETWDY